MLGRLLGQGCLLDRLLSFNGGVVSEAFTTGVVSLPLTAGVSAAFAAGVSEAFTAGVSGIFTASAVFSSITVFLFPGSVRGGGTGVIPIIGVIRITPAIIPTITLAITPTIEIP